jgi:hypothetical protein
VTAAADEEEEEEMGGWEGVISCAPSLTGKKIEICIPTANGAAAAAWFRGSG